MKSIEKAIQILQYLSNVKRSVGINELSLELSFPKSTVHRILNSLLSYSLVDQEKETSKYRLGLGILEYSNSFYNTFDLRQIAKPILEKLCNKTKLTTFLTVWHNGHSVCIDSIIPSKNTNTQLFVDIGREMPFHCTASAKVLLAYQSPEIIKRIINEGPLNKYTPKTIIDSKKLEKHLLEIRQKNFAICDEELERGVRAIAAPIKNINGEVIASITITGLLSRISFGDNIEKFILIVTQAAKEVSKILGYKEENFYKEK
ncbi:IclR family transcriptional regulator [bacterium]|nr:IclR family transcriptional regulator [bacterium]MBU4510953.1 IclR family transcriptional regulator [bacterium]